MRADDKRATIFSVDFMILATLYSVGLATLLATAAIDGVQPRDNPIFAPDAQLEVLYERSAHLTSGLTEGPAKGPDGCVYFTDMPFGPDQQTIIQRFDPKTKQVTVFSDHGGKANGLTFDPDGHLLAAEGADGGFRGIRRWNLQTGEATPVANRFEDRRLNAPNDLCIDSQGRIYFSDPRYLGSEPRDLDKRSVYRVETDGRVIQVTDDVQMPNGVVLSPDQRTLYVGDHNNGGAPASPGDPSPPRGAMCVYAFPLDENGLVAGPRRTLVDFGTENGPDGITVDAEGNLYISCRSNAKPGILVLDPRGAELAFLPTGPTDQQGEFDDLKGIPSNLEFGWGDDGNTLYVTIDKCLYRIATKKSGLAPAWAARHD